MPLSQADDGANARRPLRGADGRLGWLHAAVHYILAAGYIPVRVDTYYSNYSSAASRGHSSRRYNGGRPPSCCRLTSCAATD